MDIKFDNSHQQIITLNIGEVVVVEKESKVVWTVLGSCISLIMHIPNKFSIISHAQLPYSHHTKYSCKESCPQPCGRQYSEKNSLRNVPCSIKYMLDYLKNRDINLKEVEVTLLGGASIFKMISDNDSIGRLNINSALEILENNNIKINRKYIGGIQGISIWYYTSSNRVEILRHEDQRKYELLNDSSLNYLTR